MLLTLFTISGYCMWMRPTVGAIVGSAFHLPLALEPADIPTPHGMWRLFRWPDSDAWLSFRHGVPHRYLPHQLPWRAQAAAFAEVGCGALLVTSSVGVLEPTLPLFAPLLVDDLLMLDARLGDGSACTMWPEEHAEHGHLVWREGPFSRVLQDQVIRLADEIGAAIAGRCVHGWQLGPRLKTAAEHRAWRLLGATVNSMSLAPEVVLANELGIPCVGVAVGHKHSGPDAPPLADHAAVDASLVAARAATEALVAAFLSHAQPVAWQNQIFRFPKE